ncbi:hypothetical protein EDC04DRAFT_2601084 [Pisolithus marmoratus]|nr:hypothetical protein EDC04DRAFT_2601084 [Pisolithus marmoratus]
MGEHEEQVDSWARATKLIPYLCPTPNKLLHQWFSMLAEVGWSLCQKLGEIMELCSGVKKPYMWWDGFNTQPEVEKPLNEDNDMEWMDEEEMLNNSGSHEQWKSAPDLWDVTSRILMANGGDGAPNEGQGGEKIDQREHGGGQVTGGGNKLKDLRFNKLQKITKSGGPASDHGMLGIDEAASSKYHNSICQVHSGPSQSLAIPEGGQDLEASNGPHQSLAVPEGGKDLEESNEPSSSSNVQGTHLNIWEQTPH